MYIHNEENGHFKKGVHCHKSQFAIDLNYEFIQKVIYET